MKRILIGGFVGGVVVFVWGAIVHMALPTGTMGIRRLPNEEAILGALKGSIQEPGFYFFPGIDLDREMTAEEERPGTPAISPARPASSSITRRGATRSPCASCSRSWPREWRPQSWPYSSSLT